MPSYEKNHKVFFVGMQHPLPSSHMSHSTPCEVHLIATSLEALDGAVEKLAPYVTRARVGEARTRYGLHPSQPMVTYWHMDTVENVLKLARAHAEDIGNIIRIKVEALPSMRLSRGPLPDDSQYWEFHGKVREGDWEKAARVCAPFGCHLFSNRDPSVPIINLRRYLVSYDEAKDDLAKLIAALKAEGMSLEEVHYEYGILDTNPTLDEGWLFATGGKKTEFLTEIPCM
jgi:hypothetical protein